ncbi:hypothetical protein RFI_34387 [Reticulomyxa filosa]|uniref:Uncharacterized protein n=1 Tax=Reticulomyxa filosa TaxID=46433 RepID=X6LN44_RETFI|nr:hypothetical protein RFI_34387 [Reticulomyxa filosa]|eukprot:ETO03024.1 hypothetical protein RFI_34387 [Reticulomyxa filosa]
MSFRFIVSSTSGGGKRKKKDESTALVILQRYEIFAYIGDNACIKCTFSCVECEYISFKQERDERTNTLKSQQHVHIVNIIEYICQLLYQIRLDIENIEVCTMPTKLQIDNFIICGNFQQWVDSIYQNDCHEYVPINFRCLVDFFQIDTQNQMKKKYVHEKKKRIIAFTDHKVRRQIKKLNIDFHNFAGNFTILSNSAMLSCFFSSFFFKKKTKKLYRPNDNAGKDWRGFAMPLVNETWTNDDTDFYILSNRLHLLAQSVTESQSSLSNCLAHAFEMNEALLTQVGWMVHNASDEQVSRNAHHLLCKEALLPQRRCVQLRLCNLRNMCKVDLYASAIFSTKCQYSSKHTTIIQTLSLIRPLQLLIQTLPLIFQIFHYTQTFPSYHPNTGDICNIAKLTLFFLLLSTYGTMWQNDVKLDVIKEQIALTWQTRLAMHCKTLALYKLYIVCLCKIEYHADRKKKYGIVQLVQISTQKKMKKKIGVEIHPVSERSKKMFTTVKKELKFAIMVHRSQLNIFFCLSLKNYKI